MSLKEDIKPIEGVELQQAVKELVLYSDGILDELGPYEKCKESASIPQSSIRAALEAYTSCVDTCWSACSESVSATQWGKLLLKIIGPCCLGEQFRTLLTPQQRKYAGKIITAIKTAMDSSFEYSELCTVLCQGAKLPLELIWRLHEAGIMSLERFLSLIINQTQVMASFTRSVVNLCSQDLSSTNFIKDFISGILSCFVSYAFGFKLEEATSGKGIQKICKVFLDCILQRVIAGERIKENSQDGSKLTSFAVIWDSPMLDKATLHPFSSHALSLMLSYNPTVRVTQAVSEQCKWSFRKAPVDFVMITVKILTVLHPQEIMATLKRILEAHEVNWKSLLIVTSTFLVCCKEASPLLEDLINQLLREAFDKLEMDSLISAFLLARQAAIEGPPVFPYYGDWFHKIFGAQSTTYANNPRTFGFLLKFLTDLVPYEQAENLKVHIMKPPYVVQRCKSIFSDFASLVRTRLQDLKVPVKYEIFTDLDIGSSEAHSHQSEVANQIQKDVNKAIQLYQTTNKVPTAILEASIFRKPYYINQFLPTLLTPTLLPDIPDTKMKFIEELKRLGKIPRSLFEEYHKGCSKEKDKLLEGITIDDVLEDDFEDPEDQLKETLHQLCQAADQSSLKDANRNSAFDLCPLVKQFCTKLDLLMKNSTQLESDIEDVVVLQNKNNLNQKKHQMKVINTVMESFFKFHQLMLKKEKLPNGWDVVSTISAHPTLCSAFILFIWNQLILPGKLKDDGEISALSFCLQRVGLMYQSFPSVVNNEAYFHPVLLPEAIFASLQIKTCQQTSYFLRLSSLFLQWAVESCDTCEVSNTVPYYVPVCLLKKFQFVAMRMCPKLRTGSIWHESFQCPVLEGTVTSVYNLALFQQWIKKNQLTMAEWLQYEVQITSDMDHFKSHERLEYLHWCIHFTYIPMAEKDGGCGDSVHEAASHIFNVLMSEKESSSYCYIIIALQEIVTAQLPYTKCSTLEVPWLHQLFYLLLKERNNACINQHLDIECLLHDFFRIACCLPPFLLFGDSPHGVITPPTMDRIKEMVNHWLRTYPSVDCCLPLQTTSYFLKAFVHASTTNKGTHLLRALIHECPLLLASFVIHWPKVRYLIYANKSSLQTLGVLEAIFKGIEHTWSQDNLKRETLSLKQFGLEAKKWIAGLVVSHQASENISILNLQDQEVLSHAVHFLIAKFISLKITEKEVNRSLLSAITEGIQILLNCHKSNSLDPCCFQHSVVKSLVSSSLWACFPAGCLSVLLEAFKNFHLTTCEADVCIWLSPILLNFTECCKGPVESACEKSCAGADFQSEVWGVQFLQESNEKIKDVLAKIQVSALKNISEDVLEACEPEIKVVIQHRLAKRLKAEK